MSIGSRWPARLVPSAAVLGVVLIYGVASVAVSPTHAAQPLW